MIDLFKGMKNFAPQVSDELKRLGTQGSMEFANAIFNGSAFVPYGPGQYTPDREASQETPAKEVEREDKGVERENDGMER